MSERPRTSPPLPDLPPTASIGFWEICRKCRHCWIAAYYPLELALFARIAKGHSLCPKCGGTGLVAKQEGGVLLEPAPAGDPAQQGGQTE